MAVRMLSKYIAVGLLMTAACASDDQPSVVGTWRAVPNAFSSDEEVVIGPDTWTFRDDGTLVASGASDEPMDGRFEIDGDRMQVVLGADGDVLLDVGFVLTAERLLLGALFPDGDVDGAVGAWSDTAIVNDEETHRAISLDADGSATSETDGEVETCTWEKDGESIVLRLGEANDYWFQIDERGIGDVLLERVE